MLNVATVKAAREQLARVVGAVSDPAWAFLLADDERWPALILQGADNLHEAALVVQRFQKYAGLPDRKPAAPAMLDVRKREGAPGAVAVRALSIVLASEATREPGVQSFRREILHGRLRSAAAVHKWLRDQARRDGALTATAQVPVRLRAGRLEPTVALDLRHVAVTGPPLLPYGIPDAPGTYFVPVAVGGTIDRLRNLSEELAARYAWDLGQAVMFVLTGEVPRAEPIRVQIRGASLPTSQRLVLTIDPATQPRDVVATYRRARQPFYAGRQRFRPMTPKHLELAMWTAQRPQHESWTVRRAAWEREYPKAKYKRTDTFKRDAEQAIRRLLGRDPDRTEQGGNP